MLEKKFEQFSEREGIGLKCDGITCIPAIYRNIYIHTNERQNYYTIICVTKHLTYVVYKFKPLHEGVKELACWRAVSYHVNFQNGKLLVREGKVEILRRNGENVDDGNVVVVDNAAFFYPSGEKVAR